MKLVRTYSQLITDEILRIYISGMGFGKKLDQVQRIANRAKFISLSSKGGTEELLKGSK